MRDSKDLASFTYYRGRVALHSILKALGVGRGDSVITQAFTCVAVPEAIMATGAKPIYVDIEPYGFNMNYKDLEKKINGSIKAIIVQHTFGIPADMDPLEELASKHDIPIIEDCCHTLKSTYKGQEVGNFGIASFYSYEWGKPVVVGIGGSASINDEGLRDKVEESYNELKYPSLFMNIRIQLQYLGFLSFYRPNTYWNIRSIFRVLGKLGVAESNYNPINENSVSADFGMKMPRILEKRLMNKLKSLPQRTKNSKAISNKYRSKIEPICVKHPTLIQESDSIFVRYPLFANNKDTLLGKAKRSGIELADWYTTPVHPLSDAELTLVNYEIGSCPNAENRCQEIVTLPTNKHVDDKFINTVVDFLNSQG